MVSPLAVTRKVTSALSMSRGSFIMAVTPPMSGENSASPAMAVMSSLGNAPSTCTKLAAISPIRP